MVFDIFKDEHGHQDVMAASNDQRWARAMPDPQVQALDDLVQIADQAMYAAKRAGKSRVVVG